MNTLGGKVTKPNHLFSMIKHCDKNVTLNCMEKKITKKGISFNVMINIVF